MILFLELNKIINRIRRFAEITSSYLTILHKKPQTRGREISQRSGLVTYKKIVVARGEYQTTRYPASKLLNT